MWIRRSRVLQASIATSAVAALFAAAVPDDKHLNEWVEMRVRELQPTRAERRIDAVGWANGILDAERIARTYHRPVFLFTHDGRIETGRC